MNALATLMEGRPMHEVLPAGESDALRTIQDANTSALIVEAVRA
jgi:hypothetical protein